MNVNSNSYTYAFAIGLVVVVAAALAVAATGLKPAQDANIELEKKANILSSYRPYWGRPSCHVRRSD